MKKNNTKNISKFILSLYSVVATLLILNYSSYIKAAEDLSSSVASSSKWILELKGGQMILKHGTIVYKLEGLYTQNPNYGLWDPIKEMLGLRPKTQFRIQGYYEPTVYAFSRSFYGPGSQTPFIKIWVIVKPPPPTNDPQTYSNIYYVVGFYRSPLSGEKDFDGSVGGNNLIKIDYGDIKRICGLNGNPPICSYLLGLSMLGGQIPIENRTVATSPQTASGYPQEAIDACKDKRPKKINVNSLPPDFVDEINKALQENNVGTKIEGPSSLIFPDEATQDRIYQQMVIIGGYQEGGASQRMLADLKRRLQAAAGSAEGIKMTLITEYGLAHYYATRYAEYLDCLKNHPSVKNNPQLAQKVENEISDLGEEVKGIESSFAEGMEEEGGTSFFASIWKTFIKVIRGFMTPLYDWVFNIFVRGAPL